jgi:hypothetical protein
MSDTENIIPTTLPTEVSKASDISRKIWKFIIEIATSNGSCEHIAKAKELLKEISQTL